MVIYILIGYNLFLINKILVINMKDILTKITFALGKNMAKNETNELYESRKDDWKYDVIIQFITLNINKTDTLQKTLELAKDLKLKDQDSKYWKDIISSLKDDLNKDKEIKKAAKTIQHSTSSYGCGPSESDYGCGRSSGYYRGYHNYGCGGSSSSYGC